MKKPVKEKTKGHKTVRSQRKERGRQRAPMWVRFVAPLTAIIILLLYTWIIGVDTYAYTIFVVIFLVLITVLYLRNEKLGHILTVVLVFFALTQAWVGWYEISPKFIGPQFSCPAYLFTENFTQHDFQLGNYGRIPAYLSFEWEGNGIAAYTSYDPNPGQNTAFNVHTEVPFPPLQYGAIQQTKISYFMKVWNCSDKVDFSLKWVAVDPSNLLDRTAVQLRRLIAISNDCFYQKQTEGVYALISQTRIAPP
jgi:hypothetical protein